MKHWSLTTLREKLLKIGAKVVTHARYVTFQMAEVAVSRNCSGLFLSESDCCGCRLRRRTPNNGAAGLEA